MLNNYKCQNNETHVVLDYFTSKYGPDFKGNVLDIGANDAVTFSNSFDLIELGWSAWLIEPSSAFKEIAALYCAHDNVKYFNVAIGSARGKMILHESGAHVIGGIDKALVSTLVPAEMARWGNVDFVPVEVDVITFNDLLVKMDWVTDGIKYISIDVEGFEMQILQQIDLTSVGCECLCIEYNSRLSLAKQFTDYCSKFGLKEIHRNAENLIFAR